MNALRTIAAPGLLAILSPMVLAHDDPCRKTAFLQSKSAFFELREELFLNTAVCENLSDPQARAECMEEARETFEEDRVLMHEVYMARLELCDLLGGGIYDPQIEPGAFSSLVTNPYLPFPVGAQWTYESMTDEGLETIHIEVLPETREILGVECVSVRDVVSLEGVPVEDTIDWYAQDLAGNVWYFGEISFSFEDGFVANIDGSWLAGVDGAKPGIVMLADPRPGITYRQEWLLGEAEDAATVLDNDVSIAFRDWAFDGCVQTADFLPPEPDALEHKFFAPGIGFVYETKPGSDETVELVSYSGL